MIVTGRSAHLLPFFPMNLKPAPKNPEEQGRRAAGRFAPAANPYAEGSQQASEWADGYLAGRHALSWNTRSIVYAGATARYISESVSSQVAMMIGQAILPIGAHSPVAFRLGFILQSHDHPVPALTIEEWRRIAEIMWLATRGIQFKNVTIDGKELSWLEEIAFLEAHEFMLQVIGNPLAEEAQSIETDLRKLIPWMGAESSYLSGKIPKTDAV